MSTTQPALKRKQDLLVAGDVLVQGNSVWHTGNLSKNEFTPSTHVGTGGNSHAAVTTTVNGFMIAADKVKLDGISTGANKTEVSSTNGNIKIDSVERIVYTHPSGDGNLHVPATSTTNSGKFLKAGASAGSLSWASLQFTDVGGTVTDTQHGSRGGGTLHAAATQTTAGFMSSADKTKLDGVQTSAINQTTADNRYFRLVGGTLSGNVIVSTDNVFIGADTGAQRMGFLKKSGYKPVLGISSGTPFEIWQSDATDLASNIAGQTITRIFGVDNNDAYYKGNVIIHAGRIGNHLASPTAHGFLSSADKAKLDAIEGSAISQTTADNRYLKLTGGVLTGSLTSTELIVQNTGNAKLTLEADTDNDPGEIGMPMLIMKQDGGITGAEIKLEQGGTAANSLVLAPFMDYNTDAPIKNFNVYIHDKRIWHEGSFDPSTKSDTGHIHANATASLDGFMAKADKSKLDGIQSSAINQTTADGRYLKLTGGTISGITTISASTTIGNGGGALSLKAGTIDHVYLQFYARSADQNARSGWVGYGSTGVTEMTVSNDLGDVVLRPSGKAKVNNSEIWTTGNFDPSTKSNTGHTHTISQITDLAANYYTQAQVNNLLLPKGDVKSDVANTFTETNTFSKNNVALKIQPTATVGANVVLFQVNNSQGNSLVTMGVTDTEATAKVVINGDLEVTGATVQKSTQDIQGDMNVTGNLNVTGNAILGDSGSDQTTIKGDLRLEGNFKPIGDYLEVGRFPIYGIGGDLQFQIDSLTFEEIISHYSTFDTNGGSCLPPVQSGASRYYKILVSYSSTGSDTSTIRMVQTGTETELFSFILPAVNGDVSLGSTARTWMSSPFTTSYTGGTTLQLKKNVSGGVGVRYVEIVAYDYYS